MKIGVVSDIHSNIKALEAIFDEFEKEEVSKFICVGDVIGIGPYPEKCMDFLIRRKDSIISFVRGNHERYLLYGLPKTNHNIQNGRELSEVERSMHTWNHKRLNSEQVDFIKNLKPRDQIEVEGKKIVIEHYPMDENGKFKEFLVSPTEEQIVNSFEEKNADVYFFGHTHVKYFCNSNGRLYINPGSAGCPVLTGAACGGILEINNGNVNYKQLDVKYDIDGVIRSILDLNYPLCKHMIKDFYVGKDKEIDYESYYRKQ